MTTAADEKGIEFMRRVCEPFVTHRAAVEKTIEVAQQAAEVSGEYVVECLEDGDIESALDGQYHVVSMEQTVASLRAAIEAATATLREFARDNDAAVRPS
jgi:microcompartment protein CcmL/EutN